MRLFCLKSRLVCWRYRAVVGLFRCCSRSVKEAKVHAGLTLSLLPIRNVVAASCVNYPCLYSSSQVSHANCTRQSFLFHSLSAKLSKTILRHWHKFAALFQRTIASACCGCRQNLRMSRLAQDLHSKVQADAYLFAGWLDALATFSSVACEQLLNKLLAWFNQAKKTPRLNVQRVDPVWAIIRCRQAEMCMLRSVTCLSCLAMHEC